MSEIHVYVYSLQCHLCLEYLLLSVIIHRFCKCSSFTGCIHIAHLLPLSFSLVVAALWLLQAPADGASLWKPRRFDV